MSPREQKLAVAFGFAAFVMVNFFGIKWYQDKRAQLDRKLREAATKVTEAESYSQNFDAVADEMDWMTQHLPQPRALQTVQTELEQFASNMLKTNQLEMKKPVKLMPADETPGSRFHRTKVQFSVTGMEANLYRWLDRLQMPDQLRTITYLSLSPEQKDDTKIECTVTVEQFFVPAGVDDEDGGQGAAAAPAPAPAPAEGDHALPPGLNPTPTTPEQGQESE